MSKLRTPTVHVSIFAILVFMVLAPALQAVHVLCADGYCQGPCECTGTNAQPDGLCAFTCYKWTGETESCGGPDSCSPPEV